MISCPKSAPTTWLLVLRGHLAHGCLAHPAPPCMLPGTWGFHVLICPCAPQSHPWALLSVTASLNPLPVPHRTARKQGFLGPMSLMLLPGVKNWHIICRSGDRHHLQSNTRKIGGNRNTEEILFSSRNLKF